MINVQIHAHIVGSGREFDIIISDVPDMIEALTYSIEGITYRRDLTHAEKAREIRKCTVIIRRLAELQSDNYQLPF